MKNEQGTEGRVLRSFFFAMLVAFIAVLFSTLSFRVGLFAADSFPLADLLLSEPLRIRGPAGEVPASLSDVKELLSAVDRPLLRQKNPVIAVCMQDMDPENDWSQLQIKGISDTLRFFGLEIALVTNGEFDAQKQAADYRNILVVEPDLLLTIPLDQTRMAVPLKIIAERGVPIVLMDGVPDGMVPGRDYAALVMADSVSNAAAGIRILAERLNQTGTVALMHWNNRMFSCDQRSIAAREECARYPDLKIVREVFFDNIADVAPLTHALLDDFPGLDGLWVVWDTPALAAVEVIRQRNAPTRVVTVDLGREVARLIAADDILIGTGAQHPYHQGVAEALAAVLVLSGIDPPPFIAVPGVAVTANTLSFAWKQVYREEESAVFHGRRRRAHGAGARTAGGSL